MAPKRTRMRSPSPDANGIFSGMVVFLVDTGSQPRRLKIWKKKLVQMGAKIEENMTKKVTHALALNFNDLLEQVGRERLSRFNGRILSYQWIEDSLRAGEKVCEDFYAFKPEVEQKDPSDKCLGSKPVDKTSYGTENLSADKRIQHLPDEDFHSPANECPESVEHKLAPVSPNSPTSSNGSFHISSPGNSSPGAPSTQSKDTAMAYNPPDLNRNITEIFGKLINIYRALGDDRRSFSYYKAISVIEKLPFKIESVEQLKGLPGIGKSMKDHIQEIVTTGKLSKLEHFETDAKVRVISLFGEVWGIGPATAFKLYEKGHRTLDDLRNEDSLKNAQKLGLKYFEDIRTRIPRHEVQEMEQLLQSVGEELLPGVVILCGGSFRRGRPSCGDLDIVITHPDGTSHKGFLPKLIKRLKDMKFLREDLILSIHSEEGADSGVDTYFGLCTYPGRELRHRIDFKVYPRDIYAFGLIAWTGNDVLNRRLRLLAESKGYRLDDTGLFPAARGSGSKRGAKATTASLKFDTEKEVFEFLGFPYLEPHERNL